MNKEVLHFVYNLKRSGIKYNLDVMKDFDSYYGSPHSNYKIFHITGSNAKGSVSNLLYNIFREKKRSGLYTSPHLINFNERIMGHNDPISDEEIENYFKLYMPYIENHMPTVRNPTFFEVTTEMAFQYFKDQKIEYASVEVGLGGRLDATNIVTPEISIITKINYEHTDRLGTTLMEIAREKGGIIKRGVPVVTGETKIEPLKELRKIAARNNSKIIEANKYSKIKNVLISDEFTQFSLETPRETYDIYTKQIGTFQIENIGMAVAASENVQDVPEKKQIEKGIKNFRMPGRFEIIRRDPLVIMDGAHNPPAATSLAQNVKEYFKKEPLLLIGMLKDKDHFSFLRNISICSKNAIFTTPNEPERKVEPETLMEESRNIFRNSKIIYDPIEAYEYAIKNHDFVLVTGSFYLLGILYEYEKLDFLPFRKKED